MLRKRDLGALDLADKAIGKYRVVRNLVYSGDDDDGQLRARRPQYLCQFGSHETGHHLVGENKIDVMLIEQFQCLNGRDGGQDGVTLLG